MGLFHTSNGRIMSLADLPPSAYDVYIPKITLCPLEDELNFSVDQLPLIMPQDIHVADDEIHTRRTLRKRKGKRTFEIETEEESSEVGGITDEDFEPVNNEVEPEEMMSPRKAKMKQDKFKLMLDSADSTYACVLCFFSCGNSRVFGSHMDSHRMANGQIPCPTCTYETHVSRNFRRHMETHQKRLLVPQTQRLAPKLVKTETSSSRYQALICLFCSVIENEQESVWTNRIEHSAHVLTHKGTDGLFACPKCPNIRHNTLKRINYHLRARHLSQGVKEAENLQRSFQCLICNPPITLPHKIALDKHVSQFHGDDKEVITRQSLCCFLCIPIQSFHNIESQEVHMTKYHQRPDGTYTCFICDAQKPTVRTIVEHMDTHKKSIPRLFCRGCCPPTPWYHQKDYINHIRRTHQKNGRLFCRLCSKRFVNSSIQMFNNHLRHHEGKEVSYGVKPWAEPLLEDLRGTWFLEESKKIIKSEPLEEDIEPKVLKPNRVPKKKIRLMKSPEEGSKSKDGVKMSQICTSCGIQAESGDELEVDMTLTQNIIGEFNCTKCSARFENQMDTHDSIPSDSALEEVKLDQVPLLVDKIQHYISHEEENQSTNVEMDQTVVKLEPRTPSPEPSSALADVVTMEHERSTHNATSFAVVCSKKKKSPPLDMGTFFDNSTTPMEFRDFDSPNPILYTKKVFQQPSGDLLITVKNLPESSTLLNPHILVTGTGGKEKESKQRKSSFSDHATSIKVEPLEPASNTSSGLQKVSPELLNEAIRVEDVKKEKTSTNYMTISTDVGDGLGYVRHTGKVTQQTHFQTKQKSIPALLSLQLTPPPTCRPNKDDHSHRSTSPRRTADHTYSSSSGSYRKAIPDDFKRSKSQRHQSHRDLIPGRHESNQRLSVTSRSRSPPCVEPDSTQPRYLSAETRRSHITPPRHYYPATTVRVDSGRDNSHSSSSSPRHVARNPVNIVQPTGFSNSERIPKSQIYSVEGIPVCFRCQCVGHTYKDKTYHPDHFPQPQTHRE